MRLLCVFFTGIASLVALVRGTDFVTLSLKEQNVEHGVHNIHLKWNSDPAGLLKTILNPQFKLTYGGCTVLSPDQSLLVGETKLNQADTLPARIVWIVDGHAPSSQCLSAWLTSRDGSHTVLLGRSGTLTIVEHPVRKKLEERAQADSQDPHMSNLDPNLLWFDAVKMLQNKTGDPTFVAQTKSARIAIVGAGMSGLLTSLILESVNVTNYDLIEASFRYGGRVHTAPFGADSWFELGAMRVPHSYMDSSTKERVIIKDMQLFFSLVDELNQLNAAKPFFQIRLIPWVQTMDGNLLYSHGIKKDGKGPSIAQIKANPSLVFADSNPERAKAVAAIAAVTTNNTWARQITDNMFKAHKQWLSSGFEDFSEYQYLRNQGFSVNVSDSITSHDYVGESLWFEAYDEPYFFADRWLTIDHGMSRLPSAFWGLPGATKTRLGHQVTGMALSQNSSKVQLWWQQRQLPFSQPFNPFASASAGQKQSAEYDYAIISVPFSVMRFWSPTPPFSEMKRRAITNLGYSQACKVILEFKTRFWEKFDPPIFGGCSYTDQPGIFQTCYPSYGFNSSGSAVMMAAYPVGDDAVRLAALSDDEHVRLVLDATADSHGQVVYEQYTGRYQRKCWASDEFEAASWARPKVGQEHLYRPSYFETEHRTILIGEHTSPTHAWIASALESAVRGSIQLLLELGLVDEAKEVNQKWMGRWITV